MSGFSEWFGSHGADDGAAAGTAPAAPGVLGRGVSVLRRRRRRRRLARASLATLPLVLLAVWWSPPAPDLDLGPAVERTVAGTAEPLRIGIVRDDPRVLARCRVIAQPPRVERIDDRALLRLLRECGRESGLLRSGERLILTDPPETALGE